MELVLGAAALYLGYKGARRARNAYNNAKTEMYAEQGYNDPYYQSNYPYSGGYGNYYPSNGYGGGSSYRSGYSYGYR